MSKTLLLADDSVTIRKVVELTFMEEDYDLVSVGSGEEAVERLSDTNPDLVIADIHMPGVTGYDVCRAAKKDRGTRPVLLLVGTFEPFDAAELEASGADRHLKKPFDSQELLQTVRDLLAEADRAEEAAAAPGLEAEVPVADFEPLLDEPEAAAGMPIASVGALSEPAVQESTAKGDDEPVAGAVGNGAGELSAEAVERIAQRVAELLGPEALREVAWEVVPDLAEVVIKERLRELEGQVE